MRDSKFGIASKDSSHTRVYASVFIGNTIAIAAYRKKPVFGNGRAVVASSLLWNNAEDFQVADGSSVSLVGVGRAHSRQLPGVTSIGDIVGDIGAYFEDDHMSVIRFVGAGNSPFASGPKPQDVASLSEKAFDLPDFSKGPLGLVSALSVPQ